MGIGVLGPVTVDGGAGTLAPRERVVLAALAVRHGEVVSAEVLADALWGEDPPASWAKVVQGCVVRLRKVLGADAIETMRQGYRLKVTAEDVDAHRFERLVARAHDLLALGEADRAVHAVDEALALWRGRALADLDEWEDGRIEAERLQAMRLDTEELRIDAALRAGRYREVLAEAQARVAQAPLRERRWALLALAQYQAGRQGDALRTLHQARLALMRDLGLDPGPDLVALEAAILRHDPTLVADRLPGASPMCPYPGLVPYDVTDADAFFGRDAEIAECLRRLAATGVLVVVGPSGCGKSSLVRAGVAAALEREGRRVVIVAPGARPMDTLSVMETHAARPVLVVDQCEEAVTLCPDVDERTRFFAALAAHAERAPMIVVLRADRLGELSAHPEFARLVERGLYLLEAMDGEHLRAAIVTPARQAGLLLEPGLVDLLIREVEGEPGSLPLLSHALRQTWERREGSTLTVAGYQESGGIRDAVAQSAETVYERAAPDRRPLMRDLMLRLVTPSSSGEPVRSRMPRRVVAGDAQHEEMVEMLVQARLVTSDEDSVELAHEALARAWPRLREWLDDDVEGQRILRHLAVAADTWDAMGRLDSELYRGARLARAVEWRDSMAPKLSRTEMDFLDRGDEVANAERSAAEEEARRQVRINRRLRSLVAGATLLAVVAATAGLVAFRQGRRADAEAAMARSHELTASANNVAEDDPGLAKLLAVSSLAAAEPTVAATSALHRTWAADLAVARYGVTFDVGITWPDLEPGGTQMVVAGVSPTEASGSIVEMVDPYTDQIAWRVDVAAGGNASAFLAQPIFTASGEQVVAGVFWDPHNIRRAPVPFDGVDEPAAELLGAHFWDAATGDLVDRIDLGRCGGLVAAVSPTHVLAKTLSGPDDAVDGCRWADGRVAVELVERSTGERQVLTSETGVWTGWGGALSADGRYAAYDDAASGEGGEFVAIDVTNKTEILRRPGSGVRDLNGDGSLLLVGDRPLEVWDVAAGVVTASFDGHGSVSLFAGFGPDGRTVLSTGEDGMLREWAATDGQELFAYPAVGNGPVSANGAGLLAIGDTQRQTVTVLDTRTRGEITSAGTCDGWVPPGSLTVANGVAVLHTVCNEDSSASTFVVDLADGETLSVVPDRQPGALAVSPDGSRFVDQDAAGPGRAPVVVHDLRSGDRLVEMEALPGHNAELPFGTLTWSPDGTMIAAAMHDRIAVWDAATGSLLHTEISDDGQGAVVDLLFTAGGSRLLATHTNFKITARSVGASDVVTERDLFVEGAYRLGLLGSGPDGSLLAVGGLGANTSGALAWLDPDNLTGIRELASIHDGSIRAAALDAGGARIATAASGGIVRIWDAATGDLVHEIPFGIEIEGVGFVGDHRVVAAPVGGGLVVATTDPDELLSIASTSLTRGFTLSECDRFNFGDDCPTLSELDRSRSAGHAPDALTGTWLIDWTADDYAAGVITSFWKLSPSEASPEGLAIARDLGEFFAGTYALTFGDGRFDVDRDGVEEPFCTGSYIIRDNRVWLRSERGFCYTNKLFDAGFEVVGDELRLDPTDFRGELPYDVLFTMRPLTRTS